jgi:very-short-patch-repair endonuclease
MAKYKYNSKQQLKHLNRLKEIIASQSRGTAIPEPESVYLGPYRVDCLVRMHRLVLEVQKDTMTASKESGDYFKRDNFLAGLGYKVIRFNRKMIYEQPAEVLRQIHESIAAYGSGNL